MKMRSLYAVLVLLAFIFNSCTTEPLNNTSTVTVEEAENVTTVELELLNIVNDHRESLGYNSLDFSQVAYDYANLHTDYMIAMGNINHDNFNSRASNISSEANAEFVAENVARNYASAMGAFKNWLNSPAHRKTMEGEFTHTGVSVKKDTKGNLYFTQLFYR